MAPRPFQDLARFDPPFACWGHDQKPSSAGPMNHRRTSSIHLTRSYSTQLTIIKVKLSISISESVHRVIMIIAALAAAITIVKITRKLETI